MNYTRIGNEVFKDERLSLVDRGLLSTLMSLPDTWEFTISGMEKILPDGRERIKQSLKRLEEFGYLSITQERNSNGEFEGNRIEVRSQMETPLADLPSADYPLTDKPQAENPTSGKPSADNPYKYKNINNTINNNNRTGSMFSERCISKNRFLDFDQRSYSQEKYEEIERKMAASCIG